MLEFFRTITSRRDEDGASAVEYGLLVAGIAALIVAVVFIFGGIIKDSFSATCNRMDQGSGPTTVSALRHPSWPRGPLQHPEPPARPRAQAVGGSSAGVTEHRAPTTGGW